MPPDGGERCWDRDRDQVDKRHWAQLHPPTPSEQPYNCHLGDHVLYPLDAAPGLHEHRLIGVAGCPRVINGIADPVPESMLLLLKETPMFVLQCCAKNVVLGEIGL